MNETRAMRASRPWSRVTTIAWLLAAAAIAAAGCARKDGSAGGDAKPAARTEGSRDAAAQMQAGGDDASHAPANVVPGSYEDWCDEHGVPESLCTRCNASLIPAFKATGDWCAEHGLPESQCLACNPNLKILRPPRPEGS